MNDRIFRAAHGLGPDVVAEALVTAIPFSTRYDLDWNTGVISRQGHDLFGRSVAGRILVSPGVQGGVAGGWALLSMAKAGVGFAAFVFVDLNPVIAQGALIAGISLVAGVDREALTLIKSGDVLCVSPQDRTITLVPRVPRGAAPIE